MSRAVEDEQQLLARAEGLVNSCLPGMQLQGELIMGVLRALPDQDLARHRVEITLTPEKTTALEGRLYDRIAAVIGKSYAEMGDVAPLADDEALVIIRELLLKFDRGVIDRNRFRTLRRRP